MKPFRTLLLALGLLVLLVGVAVALAFTPWVQTWVARRFAPASSARTVSVGRVEAGLQRTSVRNLQVVQPDFVFTLPAAELEINLLDAARDKIAVTRLVAHGWSLDLTVPSTATAALASAVSSAALAPVTAAASRLAPLARALEPHTRAAINGLLDCLQLPMDLAIDGVDLDGEIILPEGRFHIVISGGGLAAGHEGMWTFVADSMGAGATAMTVRGQLVAHLCTPRDFDRIELAFTVAAKSPQYPAGANLAANLRAVRESHGETYAAVVSSNARELLNIALDMPNGTEPVTGSWALDVTTADATPFALGHALPDFAAKGHGRFSADRSFAQMKASGALEAWGDHLGLLRPELASVGRLDFVADFDLTALDQLVRMNHFDLRLSAGGKPVVSVSAVQPIAFNRTTGALAAAPAASVELMNLVIDGIPLAWAQPFLGDVALTGQDLRGAFIVLARNGGMSVRATTPLTLANLTISQRGRALLTGLDVALDAHADCTPQGWNAEITQLAVIQNQSPLLKLTAKVGQPSSAPHPLSASGTYELGLPVLLAQPLAGSAFALAHGVARGDFSATLGATKLGTLTLQLTNLVAANAAATRLPSVTLLARADVDADGHLNAQLPIVITQGTRRSDITIKATLNSATGAVPFSAQLTAGTVYLDDLLSFATLSAPTPTDSLAKVNDPTPIPPPAIPSESTSAQPRRLAASAATGPISPVWAGAAGELKIDIQSLVYSRDLQVNAINATVQLTADALTLEGLGATLSSGGHFQAAGGLQFDGKQEQPYALKADVSLVDLESAPLLRALAPGRPSPLEGKFKLTTQLSGRAAMPTGFGGTVIGDIALNSANGTLRILSVKTGAQADLVGTAAAVAGLFGALTGSDATVKQAEKVRSAAVVAKQLSAIAYTQLNLVVGRDGQRNLAVKDLTLSSPQIRLSGSGQITQQAGVPLVQQPLKLNLKLGAREPLTNSLRSLNLVEETADAQGYTLLLDEVVLDGSLQAIGTGQLQRLLDRAKAE